VLIDSSKWQKFLASAQQFLSTVHVRLFEMYRRVMPCLFSTGGGMGEPRFDTGEVGGVGRFG